MGELKVWRSADNKEIVAMHTEDDKYVVVHSDGLVDVGRYVVVDDSYRPFIGTVSMVSKES